MRNQTSPLSESFETPMACSRSLSDRTARLLLWLRTPGTAGQAAPEMDGEVGRATTVYALAGDCQEELQVNRFAVPEGAPPIQRARLRLHPYPHAHKLCRRIS